MPLEEARILIDLLSEVGIPLAITSGVLYVLFKIAIMLPSCLQSYFNEIKKRNDKYDEQMKIITVVAQQGVEAQRRGNEIIERNNIIMEARNRADEQLIQNLKDLGARMKNVEEATIKNRETVQDIYLETVKMTRN
ncbi:hypothetical protein EOM81_08330 [bacterium]|nr:hypothetical protein [bacterium]